MLLFQRSAQGLSAQANSPNESLVANSFFFFAPPPLPTEYANRI